MIEATLLPQLVGAPCRSNSQAAGILRHQLILCPRHRKRLDPSAQFRYQLSLEPEISLEPDWLRGDGFRCSQIRVARKPPFGRPFLPGTLVRPDPHFGSCGIFRWK